MTADSYDGAESYTDIDTPQGASVLSVNARTWMMIINNPQDRGITVDTIMDALQDARDNGVVQYIACIKEQSVENNPETGKPTPHYHVVLYFPGKQRGGWLHKRFPTAALYPCRASVPSVVDYICKDPAGAWYKSHPEKLAEKLPDADAEFVEWGRMPRGKKGTARLNADEIVEAIARGHTDYQLLTMDSALWRQLPAVKQTRTVLHSEEFLHKFRELDVTYLEGPSGVGKTRYVMQVTNYDVFVVDDYLHPWDGYSGEDCIFIDEFRSQLDLSQMLRWLDGNPVKLPARYANPVACYTKVYIASNWSIDQQYHGIQQSRPRDWAAFLRRIHHRRIYNDDGSYTDYDNIDGVWVLHPQE